jgi:DNA-3-methyladenine glycosylase
MDSISFLWPEGVPEFFRDVTCGKSVEARFVGSEKIPSSTVSAAQWLAGKLLIRHQNAGVIAAGIIVETEAYTSDDPASHSFKGLTESNKSMFSSTGTIYVYRSYGIHHCVNVVTSGEEAGEAVLIRSILPVFGIRYMSVNRAGQNPDIRINQLCRGPGNVCRAFNIDKSMNGETLDPSLTGAGADGISLAEISGSVIHDLLKSPRIGISKNISAEWRFFYGLKGWISRSVKGRTVV